LKNLKKILYLSFCAFSALGIFAAAAAAQGRPRMIEKTISTRPLNQPPAARPATPDKTKNLASSTPSNSPIVRPTLSTPINVAPETKQPLVKKIVSTTPVTASAAAARSAYAQSPSAGMLRGIQSRMGIPYLYGSAGPNRYDCSGFVWAVFKDAGFNFERMSARSLWAMSEPVTGDDRFKFGTLVFFNHLGHVGIVADENGFYQASSSKGVTYSKFEGYWEKRIVGYRRLPSTIESTPLTTAATDDKTVKKGN
jgi:cell wall-associated NlpC family hydrolase